MSISARLAPELRRLHAADLYRHRRVRSGPTQPSAIIDGHPLLSFCSNDYLGLANHPEIIAALQRGAERWGVGSGAAHLVDGHTSAHHALEEELAAFTGRPRALLFSTGYMANLGVITALTGRGDTIWEDRLNHASLLDGALLSRGTLRRYPHADSRELARLLAGQEARLIATDGVFSMDGDLAPLPALAMIARQAGSWLLVDDAHGLGVLGEAGRGTVAQFALDDTQVPILMGTLGKALGTFGAFVAGSEDLIETLIQRARSYIYTTALPSALAEASRVSLALSQREAWRRDQLLTLIARFRAGARQLDLPLSESLTPIQPLIAGNNRDALLWSRALQAHGLLVSAIRPPTVPEGTARLRVSLCAAHTESMVDRLLDALDATRPEPEPVRRTTTRPTFPQPGWKMTQLASPDLIPGPATAYHSTSKAAAISEGERIASHQAGPPSGAPRLAPSSHRHASPRASSDETACLASPLPLVLLHGWGMNAAVWDGWSKGLEDLIIPHPIELPGHGEEPFSPAQDDLWDWADACLAHAPEQAIWLGWSLGGLLAQAAALRAPKRVLGLILLASTPRFVRADDWTPAMPEATIEQFHAALLADPSDTLARFLALQVQGTESARETLRQLREGLARRPAADPEALSIGLDLLREEDLRGRLPDIRCPTLWLHGERDTLVPVGVGERVLPIMPGAQIQIIPGAGHAPQLSHPRATRDALRTFLSTLSLFA